MFVIADGKQFPKAGMGWQNSLIYGLLFFFVQSIFHFSLGTKMFRVGLDYQTATDVIRSDDLAFIYTHPLGSDGQ